MSGLVHNDVSALVMVNYLALVGLTIGGASQPSRNNHEKWEWDTISEMITRDDRIKHGFVLFVLFSVIAIYFVIYLLLLRTKRMNELYHKQCNPMETMATYAAWISYAVASVTLLGVGVVSTDLDTPTHTTLASVSFVSLLLTSMFLATSMHGHTKYHPAWVYACVAGGAGAALALVVTDCDQFYWEYVLVTLVHVSFLILSYGKQECGPFSVVAILDVHPMQPSHSLRL